MELLAEEGFRALTLDRVAVRARASKTTMYRRWPSKEHLVIAAFDRLPPLVPRGRGPVLEELLDLLCQFVGVMQNTSLADVLPTLVGARTHNHDLAAALDPVIERRREPTRTVLRRAIEKGELPKTLDMDVAVDAIMGPIILRLIFLPGDVSKPAIRKLLKVVLGGLRVA
jgi:AcrR family transcriptional regulator